MRSGFLILAFLLAFSSNAFATKLTVVTEEWCPFNYTVKGHLAGLSTDIVKLALAKAGIEAEFKVLPWARAYDMALNEPNVLIYTILKTPKRAPLFQWAGPLIPNLSVDLFKLASRPNIKVGTLDDAKRYVTAVMKDGSTHIFLKSKGFREGDNLDVAASNDLGLNKLFLERVDLISGNPIAMAHLLKSMGHSFSELEKVATLYTTGLYTAVSLSTSPALTSRIQKSFDELPPQVIEELVQSYLH